MSFRKNVVIVIVERGIGSVQSWSEQSCRAMTDIRGMVSLTHQPPIQLQPRTGLTRVNGASKGRCRYGVGYRMVSDAAVCQSAIRLNIAPADL